MTWVFQGHIEKIPLFERVCVEGNVEAGGDRLRWRRSYRCCDYAGGREFPLQRQMQAGSEALGHGGDGSGGRCGCRARSD